MLRLRWIVDIERRPTIHALAIVTRRKHRQRTVPFRREDQDDIHILPGCQCPKAIDLLGRKIPRRLLSQMRNLAADSSDFKPVRESSQCRSMPRLPSFPKPDNSYPQFHECAVATVAAKSLYVS